MPATSQILTPAPMIPSLSGTFMHGLPERRYGFAWRVLDAQYVRTCGLPFAVPQRRRRLFVVGYSGDWRPAGAVLFDGTSLRGDPPPRRQAGDLLPSESAFIS